MKYKILSYSETKDVDIVEFDDYGASILWYNRSMTSDIYKIELYENDILRNIKEK